MQIRETIQKRAKQAAEQYRESYLSEQVAKYKEAISEYEELLTEYYRLEINLKFFNAMENQRPQEDRKKEIEEIKQQHILLLKRIRGIESAGILEEYDAVMVAIKEMDANI